MPDAGKFGHSPYPTFYHPIVSLAGLQKFAGDNNLSVLFATGTNFPVSKNAFVQLVARVICTTLSIFSLGRLRGDFSGLAIILKRPDETLREY